MKKILLSALPVLCAALLMTACDDDNATANYSVPLDEAVGSYTGDKLQINVGGQPMENVFSFCHFNYLRQYFFRPQMGVPIL